MEVFAGFLTHTDAQVARVLDFIAELGELDNTIVMVMSDNGASAEGGAKGSFNEQYFFNFVPESVEENLRRIDDLGTPRANNHYPWGWAWAGNTPLKRFKRDTHEGGIADPLIVHWPSGLGRDGGDTPSVRARHRCHAHPARRTRYRSAGGDRRSRTDARSRARASRPRCTTRNAAERSHVTQYYEMLGSRALYHDGWKAVVFHPSPFLAYDGSDATAAVRRGRVGAVPRRRGLLGDPRRRREPSREGRRARTAVVGARPPSTKRCRSTTNPAASPIAAIGVIATSSTPASVRSPKRWRPTCATAPLP